VDDTVKSLRLEFQATLPSGSDLYHLAPVATVPLISIHAPKRERLINRIERDEYFIFQSTLPSGSDEDTTKPFPKADYFNPRSQAGATQYWSSRVKEGKISIHAPKRERPAVDIAFVIGVDISIHAPKRERLESAVLK